MIKSKIILASSSPRRKELLFILLKNFGLKFQIIPANIEESVPIRIKNAGIFVEKLALQKVNAISKKHKGIIIGADTLVVINGNIYGKPKDKKSAVNMLKKLSGRVHRVYTGIAISDNIINKGYSSYEVTKVKFRKLSSREINFYVDSGAAMDKAGAYGIQDDFSCTFVQKITGDYFNIVGLPLLKTYMGLKKIIGVKI